MSTTAVTLVAGTRPEIIKLAPVLRVLEAHPAFAPRLLLTGQHREMLEQACAAFGITPDVDLALMETGQTPSALMARTLDGVARVLDREPPDLVLVHGDTTTCLAAALAAFHARIPVGHVEAGLRSHDLTAPWPEEMHRRLTDPLCRWCFAPTPRAGDQLRAEGVPAERIFVTGNTAVDAVEHALAAIRRHPPALPVELSSDTRLVVVTGHRRESFGEPLRRICRAVRALVEQRPEVVVVFPVHLNPEAQSPIREVLSGLPRVHLVPPLDYLPFIALLARAAAIITDSGGIQEEAPSIGTPVIVTRQVTERPEAVECGVATLVGFDEAALHDAVARVLDAPRPAVPPDANPFGDGQAGRRIVDVLAATRP